MAVAEVERRELIDLDEATALAYVEAVLRAAAHLCPVARTARCGIARACAFAIGEGRSITVCAAEDLVVHEVFAGRDKDWLDVAGIVTRQAGALDAELIWTELLPLLELEDDTTSTSSADAARSRYEVDKTTLDGPRHAATARSSR